MKPMVKFMVCDHYTLKTHQDIGHDEETEIIGFSMQDLSRFTRALITEAACMVRDPIDRTKILTTLGD
jgi:hypothetical protein